MENVILCLLILLFSFTYRYPYEYEGGHIRDAINIFTKEQLLKDYNEGKLGKKSPKTEHNTEKRNVLIFHCEFSSERGPSL